MIDRWWMGTSVGEHTVNVEDVGYLMGNMLLLMDGLCFVGDIEVVDIEDKLDICLVFDVQHLMMFLVFCMEVLDGNFVYLYLMFVGISFFGQLEECWFLVGWWLLAKVVDQGNSLYGKSKQNFLLKNILDNYHRSLL